MKNVILAALTGLLSISAFAQTSATMAAPAGNSAPVVHHHHKHKHKHHHHHVASAQGGDAVKQ